MKIKIMKKRKKENINPEEPLNELKIIKMDKNLGENNRNTFINDGNRKNNTNILNSVNNNQNNKKEIDYGKKAKRWGFKIRI